jgi:hypothetical protein
MDIHLSIGGCLPMLIIKYAYIEKNLIRLAVLAGILLTIFCRSIAAQEKVPKGVKFEIVSTRALSDKEVILKAGDQVGIDIAIRLRLSAEQGLEYFTFKGSIAPLGYKIQILKERIVWIYGDGKAQSPGIESLRYGEWLLLTAPGAIEWEQLGSTWDAGKQLAYTVFIKEKEKNKTREIISDKYIVPSKKELEKP